jgi:hypothetical protein
MKMSPVHRVTNPLVAYGSDPLRFAILDRPHRQARLKQTEIVIFICNIDNCTTQSCYIMSEIAGNAKKQ